MSSPYAIHPESYLGHLLEGGYRIDRLVGLGGFAAVYRAMLFDGTTLAIKIPLSKSEQAMRRFLREIKVMQSLPVSPHLVRFLGHGQTAEGRPFLAMEYVRGPTLSHGLRARPKLSVNEACVLIYQVTRALMALHSYGIVHRDVKPSNVLLAPDGTVKLFDFGLVLDSVGMLRLFEEEDILSGRDFAEDIEKGAVAGTPEYMAPEQFEDALSKEAGARRTGPQADVFSTGIILYRLITGALPHALAEGQDRPRTGRAVLEYIRGRNAAIETLRRPAEIDESLWGILMRALSSAPESRQFDAGLFGEDLHGYLNDGTGPLGLDAPPTDVTDAYPSTRRGPQVLSAEALFGDLDLDGDTWDGAFVPWDEI